MVRNKIIKSIIQNSKYCYETGVTTTLHKHHIYNGPLREWSEANGLWVYLAWNIHVNLHASSELAIELKRIGQYYYLKSHSLEEFMAHTRKNYLVEPLTEQEKNKYGIDCKTYDLANDDILTLFNSNDKVSIAAN